MLIHNSSIIIRPFTPSDASSFASAVNESIDSLLPWMAWAHEGYSMDEALQWFNCCDVNRAAGNAYDMGIFCAKTQEFLGGIAVNEVRRKYGMGNIGYWVRKSHQHQGVATQATRLLMPYVLLECKLTRLEFVIAEDNIASQRVAEKVGAFKEGIAKNRLLVEQKPRSAIMYSIIA